ncbi:hypothetical protein CPB83DRAFT_894392 [Crepidotus variabilis]|uniref:Uncharacterized protein n=1 Tax=Crepidotus variabilis TaxID=179855 RepID=A0A9P6EGK6_9AGAR|nr:hypothetical protein CPB83DRAFT_894392 [Crepidotus variabilis]
MALPQPTETGADLTFSTTTNGLSLPARSVHIVDVKYPISPRDDDELEIVDTFDGQPSHQDPLRPGSGFDSGGSRSLSLIGEAFIAMQTATSVSMTAHQTSLTPPSSTTDPETPPTVFASSTSAPVPPIPVRTLLLIVGGFLIFGPLLLLCMSPCITRRLGELIRKSKREFEKKWMHSRKRDLVRSFYARDRNGDGYGGENRGAYANRDWAGGRHERHVPVRKGSGYADSTVSVPSVCVTEPDDEKRGDCYSMDFKDPSLRRAPYAAHEPGHGHVGANLIPHPYLTSYQQQQYAQDLNRLPSTSGSEHSAHSCTSTHSSAHSGSGSQRCRPAHRSRISKALPPLPFRIDLDSSFDVNIGAGIDAHLIRTPTLDTVQAHTSISRAQTHHTYTPGSMSMSAPMRPPRPPTVDTPNLSDSVYLACVDIELPYIDSRYGDIAANRQGGPGESVDLGIGGNFAGVGTCLSSIQKNQPVQPAQQILSQPTSLSNSHQISKPSSISKPRIDSVPRSILKHRPDTKKLTERIDLDDRVQERERGKEDIQEQEQDIASILPQIYDSKNYKKFKGTSADYVRLGSDEDYHPSEGIEEEEDGERRNSSESRHMRTLSAPSLGHGHARSGSLADIGGRGASNDFNTIKSKLREFKKSAAFGQIPATGVSKTPRFSISLPKTQRSFLRMSRANAASVFQDISNSTSNAASSSTDTPLAPEAEVSSVATVPQDQAVKGEREDPPVRRSKIVRESLADVRESLVKKVIDRKHRRSRSASGWAYPRKSQLKTVGFDLENLNEERKKKKVGFAEDGKEALGVVDE